MCQASGRARVSGAVKNRVRELEFVWPCATCCGVRAPDPACHRAQLPRPHRPRRPQSPRIRSSAATTASCSIAITAAAAGAPPPGPRPACSGGQPMEGRTTGGLGRLCFSAYTPPHLGQAPAASPSRTHAAAPRQPWIHRRTPMLHPLALDLLSAAARGGRRSRWSSAHAPFLNHQWRGRAERGRHRRVGRAPAEYLICRVVLDLPRRRQPTQHHDRARRWEGRQRSARERESTGELRIEDERVTGSRQPQKYFWYFTS
jgi:hypothetical protein